MARVTVLQFEGVRFGYNGTPVLEGLSLSLEPGEGVALMGPNGAGKTTVTRLAMALEQPTDGQVLVAGAPTEGRRPEDLAPRVGYLFQDSQAQIVERTVQAEVAFGPRALGWGEERIDEAVRTVLDDLGLAEVAGRHPYDLPLPVQRLVALGCALVAQPELLLLDEPTAGVSREVRETICQVVLEQRDRGMTVVAATHDVAFAAECLDRALLLDQGRIVVDAPLADLLGRDDGPQPPPAVLVARALGFPRTILRLTDVAARLAETA